MVTGRAPAPFGLVTKWIPARPRVNAGRDSGHPEGLALMLCTGQGSGHRVRVSCKWRRCAYERQQGLLCVQVLHSEVALGKGEVLL